MFPNPGAPAGGMESNGVSQEEDFVQAALTAYSPERGLANEIPGPSPPSTAFEAMSEPAHQRVNEAAATVARAQEREPVRARMKVAPTEPPTPREIVASQLAPADPSLPAVSPQSTTPVLRPAAAAPYQNSGDSSLDENSVSTRSGPLLRPADIQEQLDIPSSARSRREFSEPVGKEAIDVRVANDLRTITPADFSDPRARSGTLIVPRIVSERIAGDTNSRSLHLPAPSAPPRGDDFSEYRSSTTLAWESATGAVVRPPAGLDTGPIQTGTSETIQPVINVTIGRVEVRAAASRSSTRKDRNSAPAATPTGLDEYLRQRAQGGKR